MGKNPFGMVGGFVAGAAKVVVDTAGKTVNEVGKAADNAAHTAGKAVGDAANVAGEIADNAVTIAEEAANDAGKAADEASRNLIGIAQNAGNNALGVMGDAGRAIQGAAASTRTIVGKVAGEAAGVAGEKIQAVADAVQEGAHELKKNKYNPVFPDDYFSPDYDRPNMIVLVDEDVRKGIDVCEGAMGWFSKEGDLEVLHLYMKDVERSGVGFYPFPILGAVYYVDTFDSERFIKIDEYFETVKKDRTTELREIARALGAKKCTIELIDEEKTSKKAQAKANGSFKKGIVGSAKGDGEVDYSSANCVNNKNKVIATFSGDAVPEYPRLRWFAHDSEVHFLVNACLGGEGSNKMKNYQLSLESSSSETMSLDMAAKIDVAIKGMKIKTNFSFQGKVKKEMASHFLYSVEF